MAGRNSQISCALCRSSYCEEQSHVIPAFVIKYLKRTSPTGYLRGTRAPNQRLTDGPKHELLCGACEDRFSVWEGRFAQQIWRPLTEGRLGSEAFEYGGWLARFAVSVTWRALTSMVHGAEAWGSVVSRFDPDGGVHRFSGKPARTLRNIGSFSKTCWCRVALWCRGDDCVGL